ncbi:MAG TPA: hypothetical protein VGD66_02345 [Allosphingosinicella sp.]|jgi:hypothetical protein
MKKIALTLAAVAALGVAACTPKTDDAANNGADLNATENAAAVDVNGAAVDANSTTAVDATNSALDSAGNTLGNAATDAGNAAAAGGDAVQNATR